MKSVSFFASYFKGTEIPYYITVYLTELKKHFDDVVLLGSNSKLSENSTAFLSSNNIHVQLENNEGYDFGLWYKAFEKYDFTNVKQVALVNDSCVLFKSLSEVMEWSRRDGSDLQGITFSEAITKHIQSYFLLINQKAIPFVRDYFKKHKIIASIHDVITTYEVGLSKSLLQNGFTINAFTDNDGYKGEFSPYYHCINHHLSKGVPVIKSKIINASYRSDELNTLARMGFNINPDYYISLIKSTNQALIIDFDKLTRERKIQLSGMARAQYQLKVILIKLFRPLYKLVKGS